MNSPISTVKRSYGDGSLYWDQTRQRWIGKVTIGYDANGRRRLKKISARTKTAAQQEIKKIIRDKEDGLAITHTNYTVAQAVEDWLTYGLVKVAPKTRQRDEQMSRTHIIPKLGKRKLNQLSAADVEKWFGELKTTLSTRTLQVVRSCLTRAINRAMARDLVKRNVVDLVTTPNGTGGRPSKALTPQQADAVLTHTVDDPLHPYIVVSLLTGARTEETRALRWENVHLNPAEGIPAHIEVWRSVRATGDTKTRKSRRTLALSTLCIQALHRQHVWQQQHRRAAADAWQDTGLVFTTTLGTPLDAANVRRDLRRALRQVPGINPNDWTPRELRHSFVSLLSDAGVPLEQISQLVGHRGTNVTELVYRHQLRPVIQTGATTMDSIFAKQLSPRLSPTGAATANTIRSGDEELLVSKGF